MHAPGPRSAPGSLGRLIRPEVCDGPGHRRPSRPGRFLKRTEVLMPSRRSAANTTSHPSLPREQLPRIAPPCRQPARHQPVPGELSCRSASWATTPGTGRFLPAGMVRPQPVGNPCSAPRRGGVPPPKKPPSAKSRKARFGVPQKYLSRTCFLNARRAWSAEWTARAALDVGGRHFMAATETRGRCRYTTSVIRRRPRRRDHQRRKPERAIRG